jgi:hypothetical protein
MRKSNTSLGKKTKHLRPCPSGFVRKNGKCVQAGVGPEYKP